MFSERTAAKLAEIGFLPVLAYFATRTCPYCYALGFSKVFGPLVVFWMAATPLFLWADKHNERPLGRGLYLLSWLLIGCALGLYNITMNSYVLSGAIGSVRAAIAGGFLLLIFREKYFLRRHYEMLSLQQNVGGLLLRTPASLIASGIASVIVVYTLFTALLLSAIYYFLSTSTDIPPDFRERAGSQFLLDLFILFAFHTALSLLISLDVKKSISLALNKNIETLDVIMKGDFSVRVPPLGNNEMGLLADSVNKVGAELSEKERIRSVFGKYINPKIATKILEKSTTALHGEVKQVAIFFMDIEGFTTMSEKQSPERVVELLNEHFKRVVEVIHRHNGIVDKFIGDAILAYFDFESGRSPAQSAFHVAVEVIGMRGQLMSSGIGLHFGTVVAGNIGASERLEYTIIGDAVNAATRIEGLTRSQKAPVLFSEEFRRELESEGVQAPLKKLDEVMVKGRTKPIQLWTLADATSNC